MNGNFGYGGIAIGDIDGDGLWDAAYAMHHDYASGDFGDQLIEAVLGDGTGQTWLPWDDGLATAGEDWGMFGTDLADIDNDGDLDIGSASFGCCAGVHVYENIGDGSWVHRWGFLGGNSGMDFLFGDINADGYADFVVAHDAGTVYLGDGNGDFTNADGNLPPGSSTGRRGPALADIDSDGDLDISYRGSVGSLEVWRFEAPGVWTDATAGLPESGISATQLADMDGDGRIDLLALGSNAVRVWLGDGGTTWTLAATIPIASPAGFSAFRVGGDVDHNGRPDIAVVSEEGSWPSERNHFHLFRESSLPLAFGARFVRPRGGEAVAGGSVRFVDWISEVPGGEPARVAIDLSTTGPVGPWTEITSDRPDGGRFQWRVPVVPETDQAYLRLRLTAGLEEVEAITPGPFSILPPTAAAVEGGDIGRVGSPYAAPNPTFGAVRLLFPDGDRASSLRIIDAEGRLMRTVDRSTSVWDGRDRSGRPVPPGVYFARRGGATIRFIVLR